MEYSMPSTLYTFIQTVFSITAIGVLYFILWWSIYNCIHPITNWKYELCEWFAILSFLNSSKKFEMPRIHDVQKRYMVIDQTVKSKVVSQNYKNIIFVECSESQMMSYPFNKVKYACM